MTIDPPTDSLACCYRWHASRVEVDAAPVEHVCAVLADHDDEHRCACGARVAEPDDDGSDRISRIELRTDAGEIIGVWDRSDDPE